MNFGNYRHSITQKLLPTLPLCSVVIDDVPYHNVQTNKPPSSNSSKSVMKNWLTGVKIPFHEDMLKTQLYDLIKLYEPTINLS